MSPVKILRIIALILTVVAAFVTIPYVAIAFVVVGLLLGFMGVDKEGRVAYLVMAIALAMMAGTLGPIPVAGEYLTAILTNFSAVISAAAIAVILTIIYERIMA